eukprot:COSAG06_NODE_775_length_12397_cov_15.034071_6_plen_69_part_00
MVHAWGRNTASWASRCSFPPRPLAKHNARYFLVCLSLQYRPQVIHVYDLRPLQPSAASASRAWPTTAR